MPSTLYATVSILSCMHALLRRVAATSVPGWRNAPVRRAHAPCLNTTPCGASAHNAPPSPPIARAERRATPAVRVVRVVEAGQTTAQGGRMDISGRMADVCAELDRMVARESALRPGA